MKVKFRLFGTLSQAFPGYKHSEGIEMEIPEGATVKDLLTLLELSQSRGVMVMPKVAFSELRTGCGPRSP